MQGTAKESETLPDALLQRADTEVARSLVLRTIAAARAAEKRLDNPLDTEALHDFRVAIRRLRSLLRAWDQQLEGVRRKDRRALREIQRATGAGREAEVTLVWLAKQRGDMAPSQAPGLSWLLAMFEQRREKCSETLDAGVRAAFLTRMERLEKRLRRAQPGADDERAVLFAHSLAERLQALAEELRHILDAVADVEDAALLHSARIVGKRLRYLLEPVRAQLPPARRLVKQSKKVQDLLGDLNDVHVLMAEIEAAVGVAAARRAKRLRRALRKGDLALAGAEASESELPGFVELYERLERRRTELLEELAQARRDGELDRWVATSLELAEDLRAVKASPQ